MPLSTGDIATPIRAVLRDYPRVTVLQTTAYDVRPAEKVLVHEHGETPFDALIVATGVHSPLFRARGMGAVRAGPDA